MNSLARHYLDNRRSLTGAMIDDKTTWQDAEDLVQDAYLVALEAQDTFNRSWLYGVLLNCRSNLKKARKRERRAVGIFVARYIFGKRHILENEHNEDVVEAVEGILQLTNEEQLHWPAVPEDHLECARMYLDYDITIREIAEIVGKSRMSVWRMVEGFKLWVRQLYWDGLLASRSNLFRYLLLLSDLRQ